MSFLNENMISILVVLLAISEGLALIPKLKSNSVLTLVMNLLKMLIGDKKPAGQDVNKLEQK